MHHKDIAFFRSALLILVNFDIFNRVTACRKYGFSAFLAFFGNFDAHFNTVIKWNDQTKWCWSHKDSTFMTHAMKKIQRFWKTYFWGTEYWLRLNSFFGHESIKLCRISLKQILSESAWKYTSFEYRYRSMLSEKTRNCF